MGGWGLTNPIFFGFFDPIENPTHQKTRTYKITVTHAYTIQHILYNFTHTKPNPYKIQGIEASMRRIPSAYQARA